MKRFLIALALILPLTALGACTARQQAEVAVEAGRAALLGKTRSEVFICNRRIVDALETAAPGDIDWAKVDAAVAMCGGAKAMMDIGKPAIFIAKEAQGMVRAGITLSESGDPLASLIARRRGLINELRSRGLAVPPAGDVAPGPGAALAPSLADPTAVDGLTIPASPTVILGQVIKTLTGMGVP